jgi:P-type Cu+ transporter
MDKAEQIKSCFHCGEDCNDGVILLDDHDFCCHGCKTVYTLLNDTGLISYYEIDKDSPGSTIKSNHTNKDFLDLEEVKRQFIDFTEGSRNKVTLYLPSIHCAACIWLLEKMEQLNPGVYRSEVNFLRKEVTIHFNSDVVSLKELVILLEDLGYPADLQRDRTKREGSKESKKLLLKLGVAGFAFGNIMLFSFPEYLSLDDASLDSFKGLFNYLNLGLAIPVLLYSSVDFIKSAWKSLKVRFLTIDVPIALGIITLFGRSAFDILSGSGPGYFDSFAGLVFFLLVGKWYQSRTYEALAFDRDFKSYFPIAVNRIKDDKEEVCMLENIEQGDRLRLLNNQVIPADAILIKGIASVDYSFVNGESDLVEKREGDYLYAGGRQTGGAIEVEVIKEVSQSYLTGLWNQSTFSEQADEKRFSALIDRVSRYFSIGILSIALLTLAFWLWADPTEAFDAFTAVLIIACPCALALSMPFASGNVSRILGKLGFFVKNASTLERMANTDTVVFDKTGTLTKAHTTSVRFEGKTLSQAQVEMIKSVVSNSTHPLSVAIRDHLAGPIKMVDQFEEAAGKGVKAIVDDKKVLLGALSLMPDSVTQKLPEGAFNESVVHAWIDDAHQGYFLIEKEIRKGIPALVRELQVNAETYLLIGDHEGERERMEEIFGKNATMRFKQSPMDKLDFIRGLQSNNHQVIMLGDGLNDAGALKQAEVGIAVADDVFSFSPACDAILQADRLAQLADFLRYIKRSINIVKMSIVISLLYNVVGLFFAVQGLLTPIVAAILMPLSSVTVVAFVSFLTSAIRPRG